MVRHMTDTYWDPAEIHQIGLDEVARITAEMDAILQAQGYTEGTVGERMQQLGAEERFLYPNTDEGREAALADARAQIDAINVELPNWFNVIPKHPVEVRRVPEFSEKLRADGLLQRPGTGRLTPGHLLAQSSRHGTAPEIRAADTDLSRGDSGSPHAGGDERRTGPAADRLGDVVEFGGRGAGPFTRSSWPPRWACMTMIRMAIWVGCRRSCIAPSGSSSTRACMPMKWSREQAIDYMIDAEGLEESTAVSEIERYAVWPGQALGYKLGMLKILELREEAQERLGDRFDMREFNDTVLLVAATPLPYIEATVRDWIDQKAM